MPNVQAALESQGHTIDWTPRLVNRDDTADADLLISVGCDHESIPTTKAMIEWDVPMLSEDFTGSVDAIHDHAEALAVDLAAAR